MSETPTPQDPQQRDQPAMSTRWTRAPIVQPNSPAFKHLTEDLGLSPAIVEAATKGDALREGPGGTAWYPHRDANGGITGVSTDSKDLPHAMLRGSQKALVRLAGGDAPTRIVFTEQPSEALAIAQIEKLRPDTLYVASAGSLSTGSSKALAEELRKIAELPGAELGIATNRGNQGESTAQYVAKVAETAGVQTVRYAPTDKSFTWTAYLKANPEAARLPEATSATSNTGASINQAGETSQAAPQEAPDRSLEVLRMLSKIAETSNAPEMMDILPKVQALIEAGQANPTQMREPAFQMKIGWALMDVEKHTGQKLALPDDQRAAIKAAGETMPGLSNQDVRLALVATKNIRDQELVDRIRDFASFVAAQPYPQMTPEINAKTTELGRSLFESIAQIGATEAQRQTDRSAAATTAQSTQRTAQSTQQTAQSTQQADAAEGQRVHRAESTLEKNASATTDVQKAKEQPVVQSGGGLMMPLRQPGNFLERLNGIALAWHERFQGEGSIHRKLLAQQAEEMRARGETPPPMPPIPPAPNFTAPRAPEATTPASPKPAGESPQASAANAPTPSSNPGATAATPKRSAFQEYTHDIIFGSKRPEEAGVARADAPAAWPKTADTGLTGVIGNLGADSSQSRIGPAIDRATVSGKEAAAAMNDLLAGPGRDIMGKITAAARAEGNDVSAVITEMKPDGKYAGLRQEFDKAVQENPALGAAIENAVTKLNAYGEDRAKVDTAYRKFDLDPKDAEAHFKAQDQVLAEAARAFPGDKPGKSLIESLSEIARDAVRNMIALVRQAFGMDPGAMPQPQQDTGPGMGM